MSLRINTDDIAEVLLSDGWHLVEPDTFDLDSYEFFDGEEDRILGGGDEDLVPSTGFTFIEAGGKTISGARTVCGPLTSVLAVRLKKSGRGKE